MSSSRMAELAKKKILVVNVPNLYDRMWNILRKEPQAVNALSNCNENPLMKVLKSKRCSLQIVKLLISFNVDVNLEDIFLHTPLYIAFYYNRGREVIEALLDAGAYPWRTRCFCNLNKCILCKAFERRTNAFAYDLMLNKIRNGHIMTRIMHFSAWVCVLNMAWRREIFLKMLWKDYQFDINAVNGCGQTVLCYALQLRNAVPCCIGLLLSMGAKIDACAYHESSLHCLVTVLGSTKLMFRKRLKKEVVKALLEGGACTKTVNSNGRTPLQGALLQTRYEIGAIELLLDQPDVDMNSDLLCLALHGPRCDTSVLELLIDRGAQVNYFDELGFTPLHRAIEVSTLSVIRLLLNRGANVNATTTGGITPLLIALDKRRDSTVVNMLIAAGASVALVEDGFRHTIVKHLLDDYEEKKGQQALIKFKSLIKYFFLQPTDDVVRPFFGDYSNIPIFLNFGVECFKELSKMGSMDVGYGYNLRDFACGSSFKIDAAEDRLKLKTSVFDRLMKLRPDKLFPIFYDVVLALVGKPVMISKLEEIRMYNLQECPNLPIKEKKVVLNQESTCKIGSYLSEKDILMLMLAFSG